MLEEIIRKENMKGAAMKLDYIDIGVNLMGKQFHEDREEIVKDSLHGGIGLIITGTDLKSTKSAVDFISDYNEKPIWCTCGVHPHNANKWNIEYKNQMISLIENHKSIIAIGETGLDYDRMFSTKENQKKCFADILTLAEEMNLPLFLHERSAEGDFTKLMKKHRSLCKKSVVHCFTGSKEAAYRYLQMGCYIGLTGWICDNRRNKNVMEALKIIPLERIMIETDAPFLIPSDIEGLSKRNVPKNIKYVADRIAQCKGIQAEEVKKTVMENTKNFFGI